MDGPRRDADRLSIFDRILRRRSNYRATFETVHGGRVLADLKRFCGYSSSPIVVSNLRQQVDPIATAVRIGRQEMFQRIIGHLHIDDADLLRLKEEAQDE